MDTGSWNIRTTRGIDHERTMTMSVNSLPVNLTGYTAQIQIRDGRTRADVLILELTTENGRLTLGGALGTITRTLTDVETDLIPQGEWWFDLILVTPTGVRERLVKGRWGSDEPTGD